MYKKLSIICCFPLIFLTGCSSELVKNVTAPTFEQTSIIQDNWTNYEQIKIKHWSQNSQDYYAFILDPQSFHLQIIENPADQALQKNLKDIHQEQDAILSFNGGFYNEKFEPTGLLISDNKTLFDLVKADLLNGVFTINENNQAALYTFDEYKKTKPKVNFAIQNGPILIDQNGKIDVSDHSTKTANRTAIGLTQDNQIIIIFCRNSILNQSNAPTLYQFANTVKTLPDLKDLKIHSLLNLDGGPSTSFAIENEIYPEQLEKVENIIVIKPNNNA